ncbi:xylose transport system permease protein XylH [Peptococcaceae bacterium CEB3]|nr:xylose transport system permease protein XylH [Peptococcaceae bacterium CEB3]
MDKGKETGAQRENGRNTAGDPFLTAVLQSLRANMREYTMVILLVGIWLVFTYLTNGMFIEPRNLSNLFLQSVSVAVLAVGMVLVIVAGHIDLSVGSLVGLMGAIAAYLQVNLNMGTVPVIIITLLAGILVGIWQGYWIAYRGVSAFIVTLAGMMVFRGMVIKVTGGATISPMNHSFKEIGQGYLPKLISTAPINDSSALLGLVVIGLYVFWQIRLRKSRVKYGFEVPDKKLFVLRLAATSLVIAFVFGIMTDYMGIPYAVLILMALTVLFNFMAEKTVFGRHIYAIGGNKEAARFSGINIRRTTMILFIIMGALTAVSGIIFTARLNAAGASAGNLFELDAIAAAIIGGASTMGGEGSVYGAIIGALVMASIDNGLSLMNADASLQYMAKGLILLFAVWVDIASRKRAT